MMIKSGPLKCADRAMIVAAASSGGTEEPPVSRMLRAPTPDDVQSCMMGPAVMLAAPHQAAAAPAGSVLAGTSTGDMRRRMDAVGVGAAEQSAVLAALGRAPSREPAVPAQAESEWHGFQEPRQQAQAQPRQQPQGQAQQQLMRSQASQGSGQPEAPSSPEQRPQPTLPPSSSGDQAEAALPLAQTARGHAAVDTAAAAAAAPPKRRSTGGRHTGVAHGTPGKRRGTAGRKQTPALAAAAAAAAGAAAVAERPLVQPDLALLQQQQQPLGPSCQQHQGQPDPEQQQSPSEPAELPPEPGPRPLEPLADSCCLIAPQQWRDYKAALRTWELRKRARDEALDEVARPRRRRRAPSPDRRPLTMPPVAPGSAAALLREQHEAFAALAEGRQRGCGLRRAAAVRGAARISAIAGGLVGRRCHAGGETDEEVEHPADMDSLRTSAPHLIQVRLSPSPLPPLLLGSPWIRPAPRPAGCGRVACRGRTESVASPSPSTPDLTPPQPHQNPGSCSCAPPFTAGACLPARPLAAIAS